MSVILCKSYSGSDEQLVKQYCRDEDSDVCLMNLLFLSDQVIIAVTGKNAEYTMRNISIFL